MFYPPNGRLPAESSRGPIVFTYVLLGKETYIGLFVSDAVNRLFEILKMFYSPEELCGAEPEGGPIVFTFHFIGAGKGSLRGIKLFRISKRRITASETKGPIYVS